MSQDTEKIKTLVSFKQKLERKIEEVESELKELQTTLDTVNSVLLEKGFKRAEMAKTPAEVSPSREEEMPAYEDVVPLKTANGELLATLHVMGNSLRVVASEDKSFKVNIPPFTTFLVERVFARMQEKDDELVKAGKMKPEEIFSHSIVNEGDAIREIVIKNVDQDRLRELKSSIRWTLEKMYEKMKQS